MEGRHGRGSERGGGRERGLRGGRGEGESGGKEGLRGSGMGATRWGMMDTACPLEVHSSLRDRSGHYGEELDGE